MRAQFAAASILLLLPASHLHAGQQPSPCEREQRAGRSALHGIVQDSVTRLPLQGVEVIVSWSDDAAARRRVETRADDTGTFAFCNVPAQTVLRVEIGDHRTPDTSVELAPGESRRIGLVVEAARSQVSGRVVDHDGGRGIADADVRVRNSDIRAVSGADGSFRLPDIPAGVHWLDITHVAYVARHDSVRVPPGMRSLLTIRLAASVIPLEPIRVQVRSASLDRTGFYERQDRGFGSFVTRAEWLARSPTYPTDVLRAFAGVRIVPRRDGPGSIPLDRRNCAFRYVLDGVRVGATFQIDDLPIETIDAIEVYRGASTVPAQFAFPMVQARANCGVIVVWTRRPGR